MIIKSKFFCSLFKISGITLWPFIIVKTLDNSYLLNHERIHMAQVGELGPIKFYYLYLKYYFILKKRYSSNKAYNEIPFEKEAFVNDSDLEYLDNREKFAWEKYLPK